jgi:putative endonuclease
MTLARQRLGRLGEEVVARRLEREGMRIVARNARVQGLRGELDLIALDRGELVFVEVKARRQGSVAGPERPVLAVGRAKRLKLRALAAAWLAQHGAEVRGRGLRFDVVGLRLDDRDRLVEWEHLRAAF